MLALRANPTPAMVVNNVKMITMNNHSLVAIFKRSAPMVILHF
jgi:hypothetical protein